MRDWPVHTPVDAVVVSQNALFDHGVLCKGRVLLYHGGMCELRDPPTQILDAYFSTTSTGESALCACTRRIRLAHPLV